MSLVDEEAADLARWYGELLAGRSISSIAAEAGKHHSAMRVILMNERNAGLRVLAGVEYAGAWPAIVPEGAWRATAALLSDPARRTNTANVARRWLGSGLYRCERCDGKLVGITRARAQQGGYAVYCCLAKRGGCSRSWHAERLDAYVELVVEERLARPDVADLLPRDRPDLDALHAERKAIRARLDRNAELWAVGQMDDGERAAASRSGRARLAEIDAGLGRPGQDGALASILAADDPVRAWRDIPADQVVRRQGVVRALVTVTLGPSPRGRSPYDPLTFVRITDPVR